MAHYFSVKNRGFTLLEIAVVILLVSLILLIVSDIYIGITKTSVILERRIRALENVNLGTEKVWRLLKYSWDIQNLGNGIRFKNDNCVPMTIQFADNNIKINDEDLFDPYLVKVNDFRTAIDSPNTTERYAYYQYAPKVIVLYYNLELKERITTSSLIFQQAVAPLNSLYSVNKCQ